MLKNNAYPCYLSSFKTDPCPNPDVFHNLKQCIYFHTNNDKRRKTDYSCEKCNFKSCSENCSYSHNIVEQMYHQDRFKTRYCTNFDNPEQCIYGIFCSFVHNEKEFRINLLHKKEKNQHFYMFDFKTVMCPFNNSHDRLHCVYAHNQQDFRRKVIIDGKLDYQANDCKHWQKFQNLNFYIEGGCPEMLNCKYSHGWKEHDYHFLMYKTRLCNQGSNCAFKSTDCPFYHSRLDKRLKNDIQLDIKFIDENFYHVSTEASQDEDFIADQEDLDQEDLDQHLTNYKQVFKNSLQILDEIISENQLKLQKMNITN